MPDEGVAIFINSVNVNTCMFTCSSSWRQRGCVTASKFSTQGQSPTQRLTGMKWAMSIPLNTLICQNMQSASWERYANAWTGAKNDVGECFLAQTSNVAACSKNSVCEWRLSPRPLSCVLRKKPYMARSATLVRNEQGGKGCSLTLPCFLPNMQSFSSMSLHRSSFGVAGVSEEVAVLGWPVCGSVSPGVHIKVFLSLWRCIKFLMSAKHSVWVAPSFSSTWLSYMQRELLERSFPCFLFWHLIPSRSKCVGWVGPD